MKRCSQCQQTYSDETFFCLSDGTPLTHVFDEPEEQTIVRPLSIPLSQPSQQVRQGVSPMFAYLAVGLGVGLLALVVGGAIVLWLKSNPNVPSNAKSETVNSASNSVEANLVNKNSDLLDQQKANLQDEQAELEREKQKLADERRKLEAQKNKPAETKIFNPVNEPTARINFRRGNVQETISGSVSGERSFVLRASSGQYLSASVSSGNGCVVFGNGSKNIGYTTAKGDNSLTVVNNCDGQTNFSLTVSIR